MSDELADVQVASGMAQDSPTEYRGFITITAVGSDGFRMIGQLDPTEVRKMALNFLEVAEAAVQDAIVMNMLTRDIGLPPEDAGGFIQAMRAERNRLTPDEDAL